MLTDFFPHRALMKPIVKLFYKSPHDGAQTQIMLAVEPELQNVTGKYFVGCKEANTSDDEMAKWLWNHSDIGRLIYKFLESVTATIQSSVTENIAKSPNL
jgi:hypothetical protein